MDTVSVAVLSDPKSDPKKTLQEDLAFLREFAKKTLLEEDDTFDTLENYKEATLEEFRKVCDSFGLTERDWTMLLYKGILG